MRKRLLDMISVVLAVITFLTITTPLRAQSGLKCNLQSESAYTERGDERQNNGDHLGAIDDYNCALELNASNTDALFGRAYSYQAIGENERAERDYTRLLELDTDNASAYNNRGNIYYFQGDYDHAMADYDRAIQIYNPSDRSITYTNRGRLNYDEGDYEAALKDLTNAIEILPEYQSAYLARAFVYQKLGEGQKARDDILSWIEYGETRRIDFDTATFTNDSMLEMSEGWVYHISLDVKAGQTLRASATSEGDTIVDPVIVLLEAAGTPVEWNDDTANSLDSLLKYKFSSDGRYELLVTHAGGGSEGQFRLALELVSKG